MIHISLCDCLFIYFKVNIRRKASQRYIYNVSSRLLTSVNISRVDFCVDVFFEIFVLLAPRRAGNSGNGARSLPVGHPRPTCCCALQTVSTLWTHFYSHYDSWGSFTMWLPCGYKATESVHCAKIFFVFVCVCLWRKRCTGYMWVHVGAAGCGRVLLNRQNMANLCRHKKIILL